MSSDFDPDIDGVGKTARVMVWKDGDAREETLTWGYEPFEPGGRPIGLLRSENWEVVNPCLVIANDFGVSRSGKTRYRARFVTSEPFFCLAALWRPATHSWPASFAVFTVDAYPDIAPFKDRNVAVVRPEHWFDWLARTKPKEEILAPFPLDSFDIEGPRKKHSSPHLF